MPTVHNSNYKPYVEKLITHVEVVGGGKIHRFNVHVSKSFFEFKRFQIHIHLVYENLYTSVFVLP